MSTTHWTHILFTAIPTHVDPVAAVSFLHDHQSLIRLSPLVTDSELQASDGSKADYLVHEEISVLPMGLWKKTISFKASFEDRDDGVRSTVYAPLGFVSEALYEVRRATDFGDAVDSAGAKIETGWVLKETIDSSCNIVFKAFVDASMLPTRRKMAERMMQRLSEPHHSSKD